MADDGKRHSLGRRVFSGAGRITADSTAADLPPPTDPRPTSPGGGAGLRSSIIPKVTPSTSGLHPFQDAAVAFSVRAFSPKLWTAPVQYAFENGSSSNGLLEVSGRE